MNKSGKRFKFYAVIAGHKVGLYNDWDTANLQVNGYSGNKHKGYETEAAALKYLKTTGGISNPIKYY